MKKIFTLFVAMFAISAVANAQVTKLENNLVIYTTNDTLDTYGYKTGDLPNGFEKLGITFSGSDLESYVKVLTRKDYTDSETGFTLPASWYRPLRLTSVTVSFGKFQNIKKAILYMVPVGGSAANGWRDAPSGVRFQARYVSVDDAGTTTKISNQTWIETKAGKTYDDAGTDVMKLLNNKFNPASPTFDEWACDQPFKLSVDLTNSGKIADDGQSYEIPFESSDRKTDFAAFEIAENATEQNINYLFVEQGACASTTGVHSDLESASGWDNCSGKFYKKLTWTPETIVDLALKRNAWIVGIAFICATDGAANKYADITAGLDAKWGDDANIAYGIEKYDGVIPAWAQTTDGIENVNAAATTAKVAPRKTVENGQIMIGNYNIAGQRVK